MIEAGEATGNLSPILRKVIDFLEEKQAIRQKMITSMAYPGFICTVAFVVVIIFLTVLLPQIESMLDKLGGEMTWSAQLLMDGSAFLIQFGPFLLIALVLGIVALGQWRKNHLSDFCRPSVVLRHWPSATIPSTRAISRNGPN